MANANKQHDTHNPVCISFWKSIAFNENHILLDLCHMVWKNICERVCCKKHRLMEAIILLIKILRNCEVYLYNVDIFCQGCGMQLLRLALSIREGKERLR
jgi:hypothetical protein